MKEHAKKKECTCNWCGCRRGSAYKIAGTLLRYACDECFVSRCICCGTVCVDEQGHLLPGVKFGLHDALFCKNCPSTPGERHLTDLTDHQIQE